MTDDQGWGDTGYNGHKVLKTPTLDEMARSGVRFERFYSAASVCSPTRGSCLTGRHPFRYGIFHANVGHMPEQELTLAEAVRTIGYTTGHFGKWHLGTLTKKWKDSNRGGDRNKKHYSPPWKNGFDVCFSTEAKVPTYDPMIIPKGWRKGKPGRPFGTYYWTGPGKRAADNLEGDDSRVIMDRVVPFLRKAVRDKSPFFAVVWFHAPHLPVIAGAKHRALYKDQPPFAQDYFGCITAMDEQLGRLRDTLRELGVADNTLLWFSSDNGPEGRRDTAQNGSTRGLRGRKRSLFEGGVRVPGLLEWPARIRGPRIIHAPCCTSDYVPTVLSLLGLEPSNQPTPIDGVNLMPLIEGKADTRPAPVAFESKKQLALIDNRYKLISQDGGKSYMLFDIVNDPAETNDLSSAKPETTRRMRSTLVKWRATCKRSRAGEDYD